MPLCLIVIMGNDFLMYILVLNCILSIILVSDFLHICCVEWMP